MNPGGHGMPRTLRELRADLRREGFSVDHQTGSHDGPLPVPAILAPIAGGS